MTINIQGRAKADSAAQARRAFALVQLAKAAVGAALGLAFSAWSDVPMPPNWSRWRGWCRPRC